jgi:hypothetical protein
MPVNLKKMYICFQTNRMWERGMRQSCEGHTMKHNWPKHKGHVCVHSAWKGVFLRVDYSTFQLKVSTCSPSYGW